MDHAPSGPFLNKPESFGPYYLIQSLGKGAFGEASLAVRERDLGEVKEPTCEQLYRSSAPKWVSGTVSLSRRGLQPRT